MASLYVAKVAILPSHRTLSLRGDLGLVTFLLLAPGRDLWLWLDTEGGPPPPPVLLGLLGETVRGTPPGEPGAWPGEGSQAWCGVGQVPCLNRLCQLELEAPHKAGACWFSILMNFPLISMVGLCVWKELTVLPLWAWGDPEGGALF